MCRSSLTSSRAASGPDPKPLARYPGRVWERLRVLAGTLVPSRVSSCFRMLSGLAGADLVTVARLLHDPASERGFLDTHLLARRTSKPSAVRLTGSRLPPAAGGRGPGVPRRVPARTGWFGRSAVCAGWAGRGSCSRVGEPSLTAMPGCGSRSSWRRSGSRWSRLLDAESADPVVLGQGRSAHAAHPRAAVPGQSARRPLRDGTVTCWLGARAGRRCPCRRRGRHRRTSGTRPGRGSRPRPGPRRHRGGAVDGAIIVQGDRDV